jgi:hypothetical protein
MRDLPAEARRRQLGAQARRLGRGIRAALGEDGQPLQTMPPSGCTTWPWIQDARGEARKLTTSVTIKSCVAVFMPAGV